MEGLEVLDKECSALGGLFQQIVNDMKVGVPHYEDFVNKAAKLHGQLKTTILVLSSFLDTFQKIADAATNTKGATREIGACLTRIVIRHKAMEAKMKTLCSAVLDCMVLPLGDKLEDWRKTGIQLDKEHAKEYKKIRADIKKKTEQSSKVLKKNQKKLSKAASTAGGNSAEEQRRARVVDSAVADVSKHYKFLIDTERNAVRKALIEERSRYCTFATCLKPLLDGETSLVTEFQQLEEVSKKLATNSEDPFKLPPASEQVINDLSANSSDSAFSFTTPPSSPSSLGSRKSSMCSLSSVGSGSTAAGSPHHLGKPNGGAGAAGVQLRNRSISQNHHRSLNAAGAAGQNGVMQRLSSISSQDSGFTSQDTLFLRPASPGNNSTRNKPGVPGDGGELTDRPHTISSAYEKGHQRPQLQPYTFQAPDSTIPEHDIPEEDESVVNAIGGGGSTTNLSHYSSTSSLSRRPPVPQRCVSLDASQQRGASMPGRPVVQGPKPQIPQYGNTSAGQMPNFNSNRGDMVLPQPVYMNMGDLAQLAAQRASSSSSQHLNHPSGTTPEPPPLSPSDLKTPTAEDLNGVAGVVGGGAMMLGPGNGANANGQIMGANGVNKVPGDGGSSTSESSLGSSSGYGSQSCRADNQQQQQAQQQQQQEPQQQQQNQTLSEATGKFVTKYVPFLAPIRLLAGLHRGTGVSQQQMSTLRRSQTATIGKPAPPLRRLNTDPNPPPPPAPGGTPSVPGGSNSTTPRGSMEHLPPPPPHLLQSDDDELDGGTRAQQQQFRKSVAESVKMLQKSGHTPCSPKSLRRAHSVAGPHAPTTPNSFYSNVLPQQQQPKQEQIYAPVAHLQQKLQQRQILSQAAELHSQQSPEGDKYGFGVQFYAHQSQYYQQMQEAGVPMLSPEEMMQQPGAPQKYGSAAHDQIMRDIDAKLRLQRPAPPPMQQQGGASPKQQQQQQGAAGGGGSNYDAQTALRVRKWIEGKTVGDVRDCRPVLNQEIQQGFSLRKTSQVSDRSAPKF